MLISIDTLQKKTTDSSYVYCDCRGATVGDRGSMVWMHAYIAVSNLRGMISMEKYRISAIFYAPRQNLKLNSSAALYKSILSIIHFLKES
jgi:hypothetical protein